MALVSIIDGHSLPLHENFFPKSKQTSALDTQLVDRELIAGLLNDLQDLFTLFQDGAVKDDTFSGGLPMAYLNPDGSLEALTQEESKQIRQALTEDTPSIKGILDFSLLSLIQWIPFFKADDDEKSAGNGTQKPSSAIIDSDGLILPCAEDTNLNTLIQARLVARGLPHLCAYWYAIGEKIRAKRREEKFGDFVLIDANRRKLVAKRLNATPFEQAAQRFSADVSSRFCDANGNIISPNSLRNCTNALIDYLLKKTKSYWAKAPLLSLFDAIFVPVLRPMLYPHKTWASEYNTSLEDGAFDVRQFTSKRTSFETTPPWNDTAQQQVLHFVEEALNHHLSLKFIGLRIFDTFSPYNRDVLSSAHVDPSGFRGKIKSFAPPLHTPDIMQLIQPIPKEPEERVLDKVMTYRNAEQGVWH